MEMYNVHQDALMLPVELKSNNYILGKDTLKAVSVSASRDKNNTTHISLVNIDANKSQEVSMTLNGVNSKTVSGRILSSDKLQNYNSFENPDKIKPAAFTGTKVSGNTISVTIPPYSVIVLELK
jgi:alpha-N-arabinofuranosidase